ncbi:Sec14p-like phosphatidylinositol transfer family protein [Rhynchospora pubera]|uniref:Sec14p-like phosphatidylinositol transfer family protein n=1 Tax=Rhynchospora pubera TaxID=906938 RepID=A0AAV8C2T0_9POAL|nr:Sec14p-like phosphatidylinositol transfer family protein [Rhynchospora pubera]
MAVEVVNTEESSIPQEEMVEKKIEAETEAETDPVPVQTEKKVEAEAVTVPVVEKAASFREESNFLSDLKESERKALFDLRARVEDAISTKSLFVEKKEKEKEEEGEEVKCVDEGDKLEEEVFLWGVPLLPTKGTDATDVLLLKFLRAREFKPKEAFDMLRKTLIWRKSQNIDSILCDEKNNPNSDLDEACFIDGRDREGHPVCYNVLGGLSNTGLFETEEGRESLVRWRVRMMEKGIGMLEFEPGQVVSMTQVVDLKDAPRPGKKGVRAVLKRVVDVLQDNYPELVARTIFINVPFWYYALSAIVAPFLTQRTKSKFILSRPATTNETLLKYISPEALPIAYGGLKREGATEFSLEDDVSEMFVKANSTETIEIPAPQAGSTLVWDLSVLGWEVNYKEEFIPSDEGSYAVIIRKGKKLNSQEGLVHNSFKNNEAGKVVLTIENNSQKKKKVLYRHKAKFLPAKGC